MKRLSAIRALMIELKITGNYIGRRLDRVIQKNYPGLSMTLIFKLIRQKKNTR